MYSLLRKEMEERPGLEAQEPGLAARETLLEELRIVRDQLARNEQLELRFCLPIPLTGKPFGSVDNVQIIKRKI